MQTRLKRNLTSLQERIAAAARGAGRSPDAVSMVAVTKSVPESLATELYDLGVQDLGENRADALERRVESFLSSGRLARWHFVGHLQRNKARRVLRLAHAIHSVDSPALYGTLAKAAEEEQRFPGIYLQVKLGPDASKTGLAPAQLGDLIALARLGPLPLLGLMVIGPLMDTPEETLQRSREVFERAGALARELPRSAFVDGRVRLSMGMSLDFEEAIRAGAHVVRIGGALFEGCEATEGSET